jgi:hypothetical protein
MDVVTSKNNVSIKLPEARWFHITEEHTWICHNCIFNKAKKTNRKET